MSEPHNDSTHLYEPRARGGAGKQVRSTQISTRLSADEYARVAEIAELEMRSISNAARILLRLGLAEYERCTQAIKQGEQP